MDESLDLLDGLELDFDLEPDGGPQAQGPGQGNFLGPYQLIQQVGEGGVAKVWRARHIHPGYAEKTFAVKVLHEELSRDPKVVELFRAEAYVLSLLKHPNVVETFEAGTQDDKLFIAMEYIDGRDLDNMVIRCQRMKIPLPLPVALHMVAQTLQGLIYAHDLKDADGNHLSLVHRDINPANVFLSYDGRVKLGDFGVASITAASMDGEGELAGKAGYFAPEQLEGKPVDQRADLFAVSVMMFEILCGVRLFEGDSVEQIIKLNRRAKIPKPSKINPAIPKELEALILKGLQRRPEDRFSSGREMFNALIPLLPDPAMMPLAVAALMRKVFLSEHIQELQIKEGLAGTSQTRGSGQLVHVVTADPKAQAAFRELLMSRGYRVELSGDWRTFSQATNPPQLVLADTVSPGFLPEGVRELLSGNGATVPLLAFGERLDMAILQLAHRAGAVDLVFKPFNIERVLTAVRTAITGSTPVARLQVGASQPNVTEVQPKVLILSKDPALIERLSQGLSKRGFLIEVSSTAAEAIERTRHASHHAVVYDAHPASPSDRFFASQFRSQPGMGLVPILYLTTPESQGLFADVDKDRGAVRMRSDPSVVLVQTLNRLRGDTRQGRTFLRYSTRFPAEMRYGGRVFAGTAVDISRGGVMLTFADQLPPVGTEVGLSMRLPQSSGAVQVAGRVVRVDLPPPGSNESKVGVEFERWSSAGETELIAYLATLEGPAHPAPTMVPQGA